MVIIDYVVRPHLGNSNTGGDNQIPPKTGNIRGGFPLQHIPGPQKGWRAKICYQSQSTTQLCSPRTLQDEGIHTLKDKIG